MATASKYPRETIEFVPFEVTVDGLPATAGQVDYALCRTRERPTEGSWRPAEVLEDRLGVLIDGIALGSWHLWARVVDQPETPVLHVGVFEVI